MIEDELEGTLQWPRYAITELEKSQNDGRKGRRSRVREPCDTTTKRLSVRPRRTFNRPTETPTSGFRVPQLSASFTLILVMSAYQPRSGVRSYLVWKISNYRRLNWIHRIPFAEQCRARPI